MTGRVHVRVQRRLNVELLENRCVLSGISPTTLPIPTVGNPYNVSITDTGAVGGYTLGVTGNLPAGLAVSSGQIGGSINHVQDAGLGETSSGTSQSTKSFATTPISGDTIVVWAWGWNTSAATSSEITCSDTGKNTYTQYGFEDGGVGNGNWSSIFVATGITGATNFSDTIHVSGIPSGNIVVVASEFSGVVGVDTKGVNSGTTTAPNVSATTSNANDLLCSVMACDNTKDPATVTTPSGWTQTGVVTNGNDYEVGQAIWRVVNGATTYSAQWNNIGTIAWGTGIVALEGSASGGGSLSGVPTSAGTSTFTIKGTDTAGHVASQQYTLTVNPAIVVSPTTLPSGTSGKSYSATFTASGGSGSGYTYSESGSLPSGMTFHNGTLAGTPTQSGSFAVVVTASDSNNATGSVTDVLTVRSASKTLTISPTTLPGATAATTYRATVTASGGSGAYTFTVTAGSLPSWLALNATTGVLSGMPTSMGSSSFTVTASDNQNSGLTGSQSYTLAVSAANSLSLSPSALPGATANSAFSAALSAIGGSGNYSYSVTAGSLPSWLVLNASTGVLSGTPTATGTSSFTVTATDSQISGLSGHQAYSLSVAPAASLTLSPATVPGGTLSSPYSATLTATGGSGNYTFAVTSGSLPSGLALNATSGVLSGTPTAAGTSSFAVTASDGSITGLSGSQNYTLAVSSATNPTRPQPTSLNTSSSQYQNLVADFPLWITSSTANTLDYGPHGLVGTPTNIQTHTDPTMGNVFDAGSSASNFAIPYSTYLDFAYPNDTAQPFTISTWVNVSIRSSSLTDSDNPPNMYVVTFDANDGASYPGYGFGAASTFANNGPITSEFDVDGHEAQASMFGSSIINDGQWHLLVATYTPASSTARPTSTGNIYIDGVLDGTSKSMAELESPTVDNPKNLLNPFSMYIGADDDGHSNAWQGMFCDLRFYDTALNATQIGAMYAPATRWQLYQPGTNGGSARGGCSIGLH